MNLPEIFANWQTLALGLCIYAMTEGVRRFVQSVWKDWRKSKLYSEFILWVLPMVIGALIAVVARGFPWPGLTTLSSRVVYSTVIGMFSGLIYNRAKWFLVQSDPQKSGAGKG